MGHVVKVHVGALAGLAVITAVLIMPYLPAWAMITLAATLTVTLVTVPWLAHHHVRLPLTACARWFDGPWSRS